MKDTFCLTVRVLLNTIVRMVVQRCVQFHAMDVNAAVISHVGKDVGQETLM